MNEIENPKLRPVEAHPFVDRGRPLLMLRDPLNLSGKVVVVPQTLGPLLAFLDGSRDVSGLYASLLIRVGMRVAPEIIQKVIDQLDDALLLENQHSADAYAQMVRAYREAPHREPALAGASYPANRSDLNRLLEGYLAGVSVNGASASASVEHLGDALSHHPRGDQTQSDILALVSPHIDYQRGGPVYAGVWRRAAEAVRGADLAIILGTDHAGSAGHVTLTRQNYATPYGVLPTATDVVDSIADAIGQEAAFDEEIHHRNEHSVELAAVWLHHMRGGQPCEMVPVLCGSFYHFVAGEAEPASDSTLKTTVEALREATRDRRVVIVAAADLAHVGPAFGDSHPIDPILYAGLQAADERLIQTIIAGDADAFFKTIAAEGDRHNICGLPPIYLTLRLLNGNVRGEVTGYERCPADEHNTSFVSVCGVVLRAAKSQ